MNKKSIHLANTAYNTLVCVLAVLFAIAALMGVLVQIVSGLAAAGISGLVSPVYNLIFGILASLGFFFVGGIFVVGILAIIILLAALVTKQFILLITKKYSSKEVFIYCLLYYLICFISTAFKFFFDKLFSGFS